MVAIGATISDNDYHNTIIQSLPHWLQSYTSSQLTSVQLSVPPRILKPETFIVILCDEWEQTHPKQAIGKSQKSKGDESLVVEGGNGKGKGKEDKGKGKIEENKKRGACFICGSTEHWKKDYPKKKKGNQKTGEGSKSDQPSTSANIVKKDDGGNNDLLSIEANEVSKIDVAIYIEVFDSGSSCHILPYRDMFTMFKSISPCPLQAANHQQFNAIGRGDMILPVPNGKTM